MRLTPRNDFEGPARGIVVHHTATTCIIGDDIPRKLRAIQAYHMRKRGWYDIGYNFLIDPSGDLWVGRGFDEGAHTKGKNSTHLGVCLLGNFEIQHPTAPAVHTLRDFRMWMSHVSGRTLSLTPHNEHANTSCPGSYLHEAVFGDD